MPRLNHPWRSRSLKGRSCANPTAAFKCAKPHCTLEPPRQMDGWLLLTSTPGLLELGRGAHVPFLARIGSSMRLHTEQAGHMGKHLVVADQGALQSQGVGGNQ